MRGRNVIAVLSGVAGVLVTSAIVPAQVPEAPPPPAPAPAPGPPPARIEVIIKRKLAAPKVELKKAVEVRKVAAPVALPALPPPAAMPMAPQVDEEALVGQFIQQYRPILMAELHRVRTVCKLSEDQRREIAREGEWIVKDAAQRMAELQQRMMRGRSRGGEPIPDPHKLIPEGFDRVINDHLSPEQATLYRAEVASRAEDQKKAAVRNLVAWIDQDLVLSADQRDKLTGSLSSHWNDAWGRTIDRLPFMIGSLPNIPDPFVIPFLDPTQQEQWRSLPKNSNVYFGGVGFFNGVLLEEGLGGDAEGPAMIQD